MYSVSTASIIATGVAISYVLVIFLGQRLNEDRNDPKVIAGRMTRVSILCVFLLGFIPMLLTKYFRVYPDVASSVEQLKLFNFSRSEVIGDLQSLAQICTLYVGPLLNHFHSINYNPRVLLEDTIEELSSIWGIRDLVFAPITEEFVYRSLIHAIFEPLLKSGGISQRAYITLTPLLFGIAHIHHGYVLHKFRKIELRMVLFNGVIQFTYTTLFGILANYLLVKNNSVYGSILVHSVCNCMGFPDLVPEMPELVYYPLLVIGSIGFYVLL